MRHPTYADHRRFVAIEGWEDKDAAWRKKTGNHHRYTLTLADGEALYTRVSHGSGEYRDPGLIAVIFREQLKVSEEDFWRCVEHGVLPPRPQPDEPERPPDALDAKLVRNLLRKVGLRQEEVAQMTKTEATAAWNGYLASGGT